MTTGELHNKVRKGALSKEAGDPVLYHCISFRVYKNSSIVRCTIIIILPLSKKKALMVKL